MSDIYISLIGINHRTAGVDVRERYSLAGSCTPENWAIPVGEAFQETFILSTCNRVEMIGIGANDLTEPLIQRWSQLSTGKPEELRSHLYIQNNLDAVRHIFEVASSLDSMILGEPQILGQLKAAYRKAVEARTAGPILNRLMHKAFSVAKRVRHETAVASSAVSISYAAVELAKRIFGDMPRHKAMLIGAGEMAELAATHLLQAGVDEIIIVNRTLEKARELANRFKGRPAPFDALQQHLPEVDIIISSTGSPAPIINSSHIASALKLRKNRPMFLIDIAVPRDIDVEVNSLDNVYLYDIDDLKDVVEENMANRREEAARAKLIIEEELEQFSRWLDNLDAKPTIMALLARGDNAARSEIAKTLKRLGPVNEKTREAIEQMAFSLVKKMNHDPITFLKKASMGIEQPHERIDTIRRIFRLDEK